ncbi:GNAT family N-acetyltransferase [Erysipelothrix inopinata]|uniref:GNAT family N-acetyltransferase n=1 Tax=Erysipelothrix inopinata TaxID=225084 RepID=A0A7G9RYV9_9FIRM|nr:GNAT family N-acetyltransferase [Erysipelothrix inopinata]QNN60784.1 GNAT family N-acetyltransferase [Erysipelothrix inopinata]
MKKVLINNHEYQFTNDILNMPAIRQSFNKLTLEVFEISFEDWYQQGYWKDQYQPYVLLDNDVVVANVSVNKMRIKKDSDIYNVIQIGTVCTQEAYRNKGLIRYLMNQVLTDYKDQCIYLFANDTVLDFYPKFGFKYHNEYQYVISNEQPSNHDFKKINLSGANHLSHFTQYYKIGNPFSKVEMIDNLSLIMFYLSGPFSEMIYYSKSLEIYAIYDDETHMLFDVYGTIKLSLEEIIGSLTDTSKVTLGFTPIDSQNMHVTEGDFDDNALFVINDSENTFGNTMCLPYLSHA